MGWVYVVKILEEIHGIALHTPVTAMQKLVEYIFIPTKKEMQSITSTLKGVQSWNRQKRFSDYFENFSVKI